MTNTLARAAPLTCCTGRRVRNLPFAWNPRMEPDWQPTKPTCTITFQDSGATCTSGSPETGTWELVGADHTMITGTPNATGVTFSLKCS